MLLRTKLELGAGALVLSLMSFGVVSHYDKAQKIAVAEANAKADQRVIDEKQKVIDQSAKSMADRQAQWDKDKAVLQGQIDSIKTLAQATKQIQPVIIQAGAQPITSQQVTKEQLPASVQAGLPDAPGTKFTPVSDSQMIAIAKRDATCNLEEAELGKCKADNQDLAGTTQALRDQVKAAEDKAKQFEVAAKKIGGSRVNNCILRIGVASGTAAGFGNKDHRGSNAIFGAALGLGTCFMFK